MHQRMATGCDDEECRRRSFVCLWLMQVADCARPCGAAERRRCCFTDRARVDWHEQLTNAETHASAPLETAPVERRVDIAMRVSESVRSVRSDRQAAANGGQMEQRMARRTAGMPTSASHARPNKVQTDTSAMTSVRAGGQWAWTNEERLRNPASFFAPVSERQWRQGDAMRWGAGRG